MCRCVSTRWRTPTITRSPSSVRMTSPPTSSSFSGTRAAGPSASPRYIKGSWYKGRMTSPATSSSFSVTRGGAVGLTQVHTRILGQGPDDVTTARGLMNYKDTKAKCRHPKKITCRGTLRQVFIRVFRLEIQSVMLVFSTQHCPLLAASLTFSLA